MVLLATEKVKYPLRIRDKELAEVEDYFGVLFIGEGIDQSIDGSTQVCSVV